MTNTGIDELVARRIDAIVDDPGLGTDQLTAALDQAACCGVGQLVVAPTSLVAATHAADKARRRPRLVAQCGYPSGTHQDLVKAAEARLAIEYGVDEIDVVLNHRGIVDADSNRLISEIVTVREAVPRPMVLKVVLDTVLLTGEQIAFAARTAQLAGADYIRAGTTRTSDGDAAEVIAGIAQVAGTRLGIEAVGDFTAADVRRLFDAGASRIGTRTPQLLF
ncbi:2-deoxyribose-5-phosphate aldolase [Corynebacterium mendelii]|uniref:2-deoxyribose-5-phosphate aldolase n=1 Tax=Corynebacterium mendelii TaxID=2765362 RepID=A0A939E1Q6_9CORY|nr:2-deoxyribose-5-phosphate aldolase [Corynebacterium mendelii]MBN9643862.1 2-deoxyribose-5-phosphate aldolase [Corynebacterium mendelii]